METLWAPWRLGYIQGGAKNARGDFPLRAGADASCFLCQAAAVSATAREFPIWEGDDSSFGILNLYPYNNGHLLVAPRDHLGNLEDLSDEMHLSCLRQIRRAMQVFRVKLNAQGFNIGLNLGQVAGAGVPGHLHWHVVPRWHGDANFMPVTAGVRVIPQSLEELWKVLCDS
jgi:ATP adenylyltransferase